MVRVIIPLKVFDAPARMLPGGCYALDCLEGMVVLLLLTSFGDTTIGAQEDFL